jgi:5'-nucleotidase
MKILLTNDDGYDAKGIKILAHILSRYGDVTVVAPKDHQSGMAMGVDLGFHRLTYKDLGTDKDGVHWSYFDGKPASCVKFALNYPFKEGKPDVVVCGANHGTNAGAGACYSGTLGAAEEAAINDCRSIGVSLDSMDEAPDFSSVEAFFPDIFERLLKDYPEKYGIFFNINFPALPASEIKGVKIAHQGINHWEREVLEWNPEEIRSHFGINISEDNDIEPLEPGEKPFMLLGTFTDDPRNTEGADFRLNWDGWISVVPDTADMTDYAEVKRLRDLGFDRDFRK